MLKLVSPNVNAPVATPETTVLVTPAPPTNGLALVAVWAYTNPFSVVAGQAPNVVTFPFNVVVVPATKVAADDDTAWVTGVIPVPDKLFETLVAFALLTVMVAVFEPADAGVNVT